MTRNSCFLVIAHRLNENDLSTQLIKEADFDFDSFVKVTYICGNCYSIDSV